MASLHAVYDLSHDEKDSSLLECLEKYGTVLKSVEIAVDQKQRTNQENTCKVITSLARCKERKLREFTLNFIGENPLFFKGGEILSALAELFGPPDPDCKMVYRLRKVDLSGMSIVYSDLLFNLLAENHPTLEKLNILNTSLSSNTCTVTPYCILNVVKKCPKLRELALFYCSISEEVILELAEEHPVPLKKITIMCRREEKYGKYIPDSAWEALAKKHPDLRVCLGFDHTCPLHKISGILQPSIPVAVLRMDTFTTLHHEISLASAYYGQTLEKLVLHGKGSPELQRALLSLADNALRLKSLHCYCVLDRETIDGILLRCPQLESYTLKSELENHPWMPMLVGPEVTANSKNIKC
ncbi:F-box/LRR-repeat protein 8-like [Ptychodera flava]|uniref:F-box/LRR-repeat protein 8-like n=1 Tax=Ptychodera flava TaxID=63121 RepID=UPI003969F988